MMDMPHTDTSKIMNDDTLLCERDQKLAAIGHAVWSEDDIVAAFVSGSATDLLWLLGEEPSSHLVMVSVHCPCSGVETDDKKECNVWRELQLMGPDNPGLRFQKTKAASLEVSIS